MWEMNEYMKYVKRNESWRNKRDSDIRCRMLSAFLNKDPTNNVRRDSNQDARGAQVQITDIHEETLLDKSKRVKLLTQIYRRWEANSIIYMFQHRISYT